ncbi:hypothetical protein A9995_04830 [Erythrobacter sp. QSSC1-22B]|uniref:DUF2059 domain-containing protein n=1 Tax=Erythrobacter sp. QSSC1-22B TaxID=1860125 RepID=UPI000806023D|nr:DUF2059 domain-containing protein [Erythrobacter sp. QSSC1-22B]OBX19881.1 hypothetical protein A9995_04830 [Erythrobacter sp. QSSC1-22B]
MKAILTIAASLVALAPVGAAAQDPEPAGAEIELGIPMEKMRAELTRELDELGALFADVFAVEPLSPREEARLPLATRMADHVFPVGSFAMVMEETMGPMMEAMMRPTLDDPAMAVSGFTGLPYDELAALDEDAVEEALDLFDPNHRARNERINQAGITMMGDLLDAIEPAYREGLSRAYATRFEAREMEELIAFFQTPVGGKFAGQSLLVQYDPQMMAMMEQLGPAMGEVMPGMIENIWAIAEAYPDGRGFGDLGASEKARAARLLGRSQSELEALQSGAQADDELDEMGPST